MRLAGLGSSPQQIRDLNSKLLQFVCGKREENFLGHYLQAFDGIRPDQKRILKSSYWQP